MNRAQKRGIMSQEADRIRQAVKRNPKECLVSLFHHITVPVLSEAFYSLKSDVAAGVDGVTWEMYAEGLGDHLTDLHGRPASRRSVPSAASAAGRNTQAGTAGNDHLASPH